VKQDLSDVAREVIAAWFAGDDYFVAKRGEAFGQKARLGGLARALGALKGYEMAPAQGFTILTLL
jgi:hypothetical protein